MYARQAIETKFLGPTDHRGPRVKATAAAGSVTVEWDHALGPVDNHAAAARKLATDLGWIRPTAGPNRATAHEYPPGTNGCCCTCPVCRGVR